VGIVDCNRIKVKAKEKGKRNLPYIYIYIHISFIMSKSILKTSNISSICEINFEKVRLLSRPTNAQHIYIYKQ
jgi:hypothetical protein